MKSAALRNPLVFVALLIGVAMIASTTPISGQPSEERIAAFKTNLQEGLAKQRGYEWIETTVVSLKGDEKSRKQNRCYYGADGKVQKVPIETGGGGGGGKKPRGIRGKIASNKKEDIEDAIKEAVALVKQYVPPAPDKIQAAKNEGRLSVSPPDGAGQLQMVIKDYLKAGDSVTLRIDGANNMLQGLDVATFMKKEKQTVNLTANLASLPDGAIYTGKILLDIKSENIHIDIENTGHRPANQ